MPVQNKRGGMFKQVNTCQHCLKEFVANRSYKFCSPLCRFIHTSNPAQEGAIHDEGNIQ